MPLPHIMRFFAKHWIPLSVAAAALLAATGLGVGFVGDDAFHLLILEGEKTPSADGSMFTFATGDPSVTKTFIENGPYPWFTLPEIKIVFFRPLSSALHRIDFALFGRKGAFWHFHAMLWYLALVFLWALIARRTLTPAVAALATLIFAIDDVHWMPAVWLANRNALVACVPVMFGLYAHVRWRQENWQIGLPLSLLGYGVGMLGGEAWLGILAFVAAYEVFGRNDALAIRARSLAPAAFCAIAYAIAYKLLGYGVYGSGVYLEPLSKLYFQEAPSRILALAGGLLLTAPVDLWALAEQLHRPLVIIGAIGLVLFAALLRRCWPSLHETDRQTLRWLIPGSVMSLVPVIATFPMNRLLIAPSMGASVVVAVILFHWWSTRRIQRARLAGSMCAALAVLNLVIAPLAWPAQSAFVTWFGTISQRWYMNAPIDDTRVAQQDVILLAANEPITLMYPPIIRRVAGHPLPGAWNALSASTSDHIFKRTGIDSFELESTRGTMIQGLFAGLVRGPQFPFKIGDTVSLRNAQVTVVEVTEGIPRKIAVKCKKPLEDPSLCILVWQDFSLRPFTLPAIGESRTIRYTSAH
jgi:hypothetical protein